MMLVVIEASKFDPQDGFDMEARRQLNRDSAKNIFCPRIHYYVYIYICRDIRRCVYVCIYIYPLQEDPRCVLLRFSTAPVPRTDASSRLKVLMCFFFEGRFIFKTVPAGDSISLAQTLL